MRKAFLCVVMFCIAALGQTSAGGQAVVGGRAILGGGVTGGGPIQTVTFVSFAASAGETNSTPVATMVTATATYQVTAGNILVCFPSSGTTSVSFTSLTDTAGNTFTPVGSVSSSTVGSVQLFYSIMTTSNAADVVTANMSPNGAFNSMTCSQFSKAGGSWNLDAAPTTATGTTGTSMTSNTFSTAQTKEAIIAAGRTFGGYTAGTPTIGGTGAGGSVQNGSSADQVMFYLLPTTTQSSITATVAGVGGGNPWAIAVASFYAQ
jgi:hypothetical protein